MGPAVFDKIGGRKKMAEGARKNLTEFYKLYARLIPTESHIDLNRPRDVREMTTEELLVLAAQAGKEQQKAEGQEQTDQAELH